MFLLVIGLNITLLHHSFFDKIRAKKFRIDDSILLNSYTCQRFQHMGVRFFPGSARNFEEYPTIPEDFRRFLDTFRIFPKTFHNLFSRAFLLPSPWSFSLSLSLTLGGRKRSVPSFTWTSLFLHI